MIIKKFAKSFTFIELITVIVIIAIISFSGAYILNHFMHNSVFITNKLNMDMVVSEALDIIIEGDSSAKGLRFSRSITDIQDNQLTFNNQENQSIIYRLDANTEKLYRSIDGGAEALIPYYVNSGINLSGKNNMLFIYYDQNDNIINVGSGSSADVRRIKINLIAKTGSGLYIDWEGQSEQSSSIAVSLME